MTKPLVLCILDGCGVREESDGNAFKNANKPTFDSLMQKYPHSILQASGKAVGLPEGQMGTSEVGHMNLGSGRVAIQPLENITASIESKEFYQNKKIKCGQLKPQIIFFLALTQLNLLLVLKI